MSARGKGRVKNKSQSTVATGSKKLYADFYASVAPIALEAFPVVNCRSGKTEGRFTRVDIHTPEYGVLTPGQYRVVTNSPRNPQGPDLAAWAFRRIADLTPAGAGMEDGEFLIVYMPFRMFRRDGLMKALEAVRDAGNFPTGQLVISLSADSLFEDTAEAGARMKEARDAYGVRFLLEGYGDEFCPALRLGSFAFDFAMLDAGVGSEEALRSVPTQNAVRIARECGCRLLYGLPDSLGMSAVCTKIGVDFVLGQGELLPDRRLTQNA